MGKLHCHSILDGAMAGRARFFAVGLSLSKVLLRALVKRLPPPPPCFFVVSTLLLFAAIFLSPEFLTLMFSLLSFLFSGAEGGLPLFLFFFFFFFHMGCGGLDTVKQFT